MFKYGMVFSFSFYYHSFPQFLDLDGASKRSLVLAQAFDTEVPLDVTNGLQ